MGLEISELPILKKKRECGGAEEILILEILKSVEEGAIAEHGFIDAIARALESQYPPRTSRSHLQIGWMHLSCDGYRHH